MKIFPVGQKEVPNNLSKLIPLNRPLKIFFATLLIFTSSCNDADLLLHGQENAVWSESIYLRGYKPSTNQILTDSLIYDYCETISKFGIKNIYLFAGPFRRDGHLPPYPFSPIAVQNIQKIKKKIPSVRILPWIGGVQNQSVFLNDSSWVTNALNDTKKLIEVLKVDGVHLDFEFILNNDTLLSSALEKEKPGDWESYGKNVNSFHRQLRKLVPQAFISSVVVPPLSDTKPWKRKTSMEELDPLVSEIDQISFLFYDTDIHEPKTFQANCDQLINVIQSLKKKHQRVQYLVAIGTFVNEPRLWHYRDLEIETISGTINAINSSLKKNSNGETIIDGMAIFCDWKTDAQEWNEFYKNWAKNK
jgi:hypothetical protein